MSPQHLNKPEEVYIQDRNALHEWFQKNHKSPHGIWMIYDKQTAGKRALSYDDVVEEALCFGWIDSVTRSLDGKQAMYYLSPRRPKSPWSRLNKQRIEKLIQEKKMLQPGLDAIERSKKDGSWTIYDAIEDLMIPEDLQKALNKNKEALKNFEAFSKSNKKQILWHIASAKQEETRAKRVNQIVESAEKGINPLEYRKVKK